MSTRRNFLQAALSCAPASMSMTIQTDTLIANSAVPTRPFDPSAVPTHIPVADLPAHYDVDRTVINLDAAYWGVMPRIIEQAYQHNLRYVNRYNSVWARDAMAARDGNPAEALEAETGAARASVAGLLGTHPDEIAFARSGTESLQALLLNYRHLKSGAAVLCCDLDYDTTLAALEYLRDRRGIQIVRLTVPEPPSEANLLAMYSDGLKANPHARLLLLTHVSHRTGLIMPVAKVVALARAAGVDTVLDSAHAVGCLNFKLPDTGADFIGWSMHKWLAAPLGIGGMYIRRDRLDAIDISVANPDFPANSIEARVPAGTVSFAGLLTVPVAIAFHRAIGPSAKEAHLRSLRDRWAIPARQLPNVEVLAPDDPARSCAITGFRLGGMNTVERAKYLQQRFLLKHNILTVVRPGIARGPALRVTPGLYTNPADCEALVNALKQETA